MKITIKKPIQLRIKEIKLQNLKPGTVVQLDSSVKAIVIEKVNDAGNTLMLLTNNDAWWFSEAGGWGDEPITRVLGKITEIIVESV
ncbi:hypothetical protein LCGC14_0422850 [marine sediment metagenome]|uniref:Uncharacterized protein n=1 Tax=marine sediment metagenome TaxID=412755 RepID=A0A0F9T8E5_9ZZZZ